ncbi:drebrin-like [Cucumis melo var. makuwa]|uniref:Drebrin-like n=1 Tax=Cucumis melo var. makuwa TaxID=1194695 RepID=A0A5A7SRQ1_CUCMM|nr:drebrin-like [Cucumis melo var. makuwa]TYJ98758.1 drebrin-like [Cucumis melo var. makuwa]
MPTRHDNTISMDKIVLIYCIMEELPVNVGEIICEHIFAWVKHPQGSRPFPHLIEKLCLKACPSLEKLPQVEVKDRVYTASTLYCFIAIHKNKSRLKHLKTKHEARTSIPLQEEILQPLASTLTNKTKPLSPEGSNRKVFHESFSDPTAFMDDAYKESEERAPKKSLPSPPKSTTETFIRTYKLKEAEREDEKEVDEYFIFKFMDHYICMPVEKGFEDVIKCQSNHKEMPFWSEKQLCDLELKCNNANANSQAEIDELVAWNDTHFKALLKYQQLLMCTTITMLEIPPNVVRPLTRYDPAVREVRNCPPPPL